LKGGADVNAKGPYGATPLRVASQNGHTAVVQALLAKGADVKLKDSKGNTPLDYAKQKGHEEILRLLTAPKPEKE
jgi:ankyrin repeat protein